MPLAEWIIQKKADIRNATPGETVIVRVDRVYLQDGNAPTIAKLFKENGFTKVFDPTRIGVFFDHSVLSPDMHISDRQKEARIFAEQFGFIQFPAGEGISHICAAENGWYQPKTIVLGSDSHTCTGGVVQCMALGMGATDIAAAMVTGKTWLRIPETHWIHVIGEPGKYATAKDVVLYLLSKSSANKYLYKSLEWCGRWTESLTWDSAATIANMAVELGAKCVFLPPGPGRESGITPITPPEADELITHLDITDLPPYVARPHSPNNAVPLDKCAGQKIDYVFVGSCSNGRLEDLEVLVKALDGRTVNKNLQLFVTPGSRTVYLQALKAGIIETLLISGAIISPPGCGACVGTQGSIPATGDNVLTTMNRNYKGRMGNAGCSIWLSSPVIAGHTAVLGVIPSLKDI